MKKYATIIMLIALLIVGYSVGTAIAKNHSSMNNPASDGMEGVYVVEEEYGITVTPTDSATSVPGSNTNATTASNTNNGGAMVIEENVVESTD